MGILIVNIITNILDFFIIYIMYRSLKIVNGKHPRNIWGVILLLGSMIGIFVTNVDLNYFKFLINISVLLFIWYLNKKIHTVFTLYVIIAVHVYVIQVIIGTIMSKFMTSSYLFNLIGQICTTLLILIICKLPIYKLFEFIEGETLYKFVFIILLILFFVIMHRKFELSDFINYLPLGVVLFVTVSNLYKKIFYYTVEYPTVRHDIGNMVTNIYTVVNNTNDINKVRKEVNSIIKDMGYDITENKENNNSDSIKSFIRLKQEQSMHTKIEFENKYYEDNALIPVSAINHMLGILIDNAIESAPPGSTIHLYVLSGEKNLLIKVENIYQNELNINRIFKKGYSTKGSDGYGLYNLKRLVEKYNGHLELSVRGDKFYICIVIM